MLVLGNPIGPFPLFIVATIFHVQLSRFMFYISMIALILANVREVISY